MSKNNLFLVSFEYFPISQGGLARHAEAVISRFIREKKYNAVIAIPKGNKQGIPKRVVTIPCIFFSNKYLSYLEFTLRFYLKFRNRFNTDSFVFFSSYSYFMLPLLPRFMFLFVHSNQKRIFISNYPGESITDRLFRKILYLISYLWESYLCHKARKVFAVSPSLKEETHNQYRVEKNKIIVIPNGLDKTIFCSHQKYTRSQKSLLYVGKIIPRKNLVDLIYIFKLLVTTDNSFMLHIMGNGESAYIQRIKDLVTNLDLVKSVVFHSYVSDRSLNRLYGICSLFVSTSIVEGFGLVLLEAMSNGLPVVVYENLGFNDVVINGRNGYLVKKKDYNNFMNKILLLSSNRKLYRNMSNNAMKQANYYSWDATVQKIQNAVE